MNFTVFTCNTWKNVIYYTWYIIIVTIFFGGIYGMDGE